MKVTEDQIVSARLDIEDLTCKYLTERGWKRSCAYPDSCWRWEKDIPGEGRMTLSAGDAFGMERKFLDIEDK